MPFIATPPVAQVGPAGAAAAAPCEVAQLRLSAAKVGPGSRGASGPGGAELSILNVGQDCTLAALPTVMLRDGRRRTIPATRRISIGMHPGPVVVPVALPGGRRAAIDLRWLPGPPDGGGDTVRVSSVTVQVDGGELRASMRAVLHGSPGIPPTFNQTWARVAEGMASN